MTTPTVSVAAQPSQRRLKAEVLIVLGLSLGQAAIYAAVRLIERYQREAPIGQQVQTLNPSRSSVDLVDLTFQVLRLGFSLMPVVLALYLLSSHGANALQRLGLTGAGRHWWRDLAWGVGLAAAIGIPGLGLYLLSRLTETGVQLNTSGLPEAWWAAVILLASAAVAAVLEETIAVGYLVTRLRDLAWGLPAILISSALLRGAYHLYQGWPMALGNVVMGLVFAWVYHRTGRLAPLIIAHFVLDLVAFLGPELLPQAWLAALGLA